LPLHKPSRSWNPLNRFAKQKTRSQSGSPLFTRLPTEIRFMIWADVLGDHFLHVAQGPKRLVAIDCGENSGPETRSHGCWRCTTASVVMESVSYIDECRRDGYRDGHPTKPANLLSLLQTCRIIYTETMPILYKTNTFDFNHIDTLVYFQRCILPQRLDQVRFLRLEWYFEYLHVGLAHMARHRNLTTWSEICDALASFTGLQELTLYLDGYTFSTVSDKWHDWKPVLEALL
jgi:hypothetical protein